MSLFITITAYLAAAATLVSGGLIGMAVLTSPVDAEASKGRLAATEPATTARKQVSRQPTDSTQFRYGPDVNHGRSDVPVSNAAQARKQAQATRAVPKKRIVIRPMNGQSHSAPGLAMGFQPSERSSGH